jgi:hypothetical protein
MQPIEITVVALIILGAVVYLCRMFFLKKKSKGCGCSNSGCKASQLLGKK